MRAIDYDELMKFPIRENHCDKIHGNKNFIYGIECVFEYIEEMPIIDVQPVVYAHWTLHKDGTATCSNCSRTCGSWDYDDFDRFCRCCGATMSLKENDKEDIWISEK